MPVPSAAARRCLLLPVEVERVGDAGLGIGGGHAGSLVLPFVSAAAGREDAGPMSCGLLAEAAQVPGLGPLQRDDAGRRGVGRVIGQDEVLALREAAVVGRHVDAPQVAVAVEDDAHHVVHLALVEHGALPQPGDGRDVRIGAIHAAAEAQPGRMQVRVQVVDHLEMRVILPRPVVVDRRRVAQPPEACSSGSSRTAVSSSMLRAPSAWTSTVSSSVHRLGASSGKRSVSARTSAPAAAGAVSGRLLPRPAAADRGRRRSATGRGAA